MSSLQKDKIDETLGEIVSKNDDRVKAIYAELEEDFAFVYRQGHSRTYDILTPA